MDVEPVLIGPIWKTNRGGMACAQAKVTRWTLSLNLVATFASCLMIMGTKS